MHGRSHLPRTQEASGNGETMPHHGLLTWWQRRSWRMDLAVLARVRDGLKRLDAEPDGRRPGERSAPGHRGRGGERPATPGSGNRRGSSVPRRSGCAGRGRGRAAGRRDRVDPGHLRDRRGRGRGACRLLLRPAVRGVIRICANMFPPAMDAQRDRLLRALVRIVEGLTSPEDLVRYLSQLGRDHRKYSVEPAMYDAVGEALIATLRSYAGPAFTPAAEEAWVQAYQAASGLMIRAAEDDSAVAPAYWTAEVVEQRTAPARDRRRDRRARSGASLPRRPARDRADDALAAGLAGLLGREPTPRGRPDDLPRPGSARGMGQQRPRPLHRTRRRPSSSARLLAP